MVATGVRRRLIGGDGGHTDATCRRAGAGAHGKDDEGGKNEK